MSKIAIIIGAGPAGLTAALELVTRTDIRPVILEKSGEIGGISRTMNYKGNRMDMGPAPLLLQVRPRDGLVAEHYAAPGERGKGDDD